MRRAYTLLLYLLSPFVLLYLLLRGLRNRPYLQRWPERFGRFSPPAQPGSIVLHAVSMGEVNAASALLRELARHHPDRPLAVTCLTPSGSDRVRELFSDAVFHVYLPLDLPGAVRRWFDRLQPRLLVVMETEIWPNLYAEAGRRRIPIVVINARISDRSLPRYRRLRGLIGSTLRRAAAIGAQSQRDADRLTAIGASAAVVSVTGNLKFDLFLPPSLAEQGEAVRGAWGRHRLILLGGSTHEPDERALLQAFGRLLQDFPQALLVLVPRHPERFGRAAQLARAAGLEVSLRSAGLSCPAQTQCFVVDTLGELLRFYATCDVAFVGGTLAAVGGHNALEPAALGRPVLLGPHTANIADTARQLVDQGAALRVRDAAELEIAVRRLFEDAELRDRMGLAGEALVHEGQGAVKRTLALIEPWLTEAAG